MKKDSRKIREYGIAARRKYKYYNLFYSMKQRICDKGGKYTMPFIDTKVTVKLNDQQKEEIKADLGKLITTLNKSESYLMVGIEDSYDLWLGGKKLDKGAYIAVSLYGDAPGESYDRLTGQICDLLSEKLGIPGNAVYVTYHPVSDWGWNGKNF